MVFMFDGVAWVSLEDHFISAIYQQQPNMYYEEGETHWVDVPFGRGDLHSFAAHAPRGVWEMIWSQCSAMCFSMR